MKKYCFIILFTLTATIIIFWIGYKSLQFIFEPNLKYLWSVEYRNSEYCLYRSSWMDVRWFIYRHTNESCQKKSSFDIDSENLLFYTWDDGTISKDTQLMIINDTFLVFKKEWLFLSLYDLNTQKLIIHENDIELQVENTYWEWYSQKQLKNWKLQNMHSVILETISPE